MLYTQSCRGYISTYLNISQLMGYTHKNHPTPAPTITGCAKPKAAADAIVEPLCLQAPDGVRNGVIQMANDSVMVKIWLLILAYK